MTLPFQTAGERGTAAPVLLIHGGAEDAEMISPQAHAIARRGRQVIWYDRRGTGASTRVGWPGGGADQHADDAAELLSRVGAEPAVVLGFSSGGIVALALAARHPRVVSHVVAWEAPVVTVLPGGRGIHAEMMAPVEAFLAGAPTDWVGAYRVIVNVLRNGAADLEAPEVKRSAVNAEAIVRDDGPLITRREFAAGELPAGTVTIAVGESTDPMFESIAEGLSELTARPYERVPGAHHHEVYLTDPDVLADWISVR